jgi:3-oxoacyl-[acyl-carrier protein] reductase
MELSLNQKKVIITGSSKGIGLHIAKKFCENGSKVILNSRKRISKNLLNDLPGSVAISGDVANEISAKKVVRESIKELGGLDILICNVGNSKSVSPGKENKKAWEEAFHNNFYSTTCMVEASKAFLCKSEGIIICISSICGSEYISGAPITYSVAKSALNSYVKAISRPLAEKGIRICAISPGNIYFKGSVWDKKKRENNSVVKKMLRNEVPLNQFGELDDVANLALFLASSLSKNTTGSIWITDGGQTRSF